jgi:hypothetical protein
MELSFVKEGGSYSAEFEATSDFNLHIEREDLGFLYVQQRTTSEGEYDSVRGADFAPSDLIIDIDFTALVYPKWIKIISEKEPKVGVVTFVQ